MNANNDVGVNKYNLQCMDGSVCKASFSRAERAKFLDEKFIKKLESLEQQDAIRLAAEHLQDFENCPFCHYGHICPPVNIDKEFRCEYPECQEVGHVSHPAGDKLLNLLGVLSTMQAEITYTDVL